MTMVKLRWLELDVPLKVSIVLGLGTGGVGFIAETSLLFQGQFLPPAPASIAIVTILLLWPLVSSLSLLLLPLRTEQRDTLYSIVMIGSILAFFVDYLIIGLYYAPPPLPLG